MKSNHPAHAKTFIRKILQANFTDSIHEVDKYVVKFSPKLYTGPEKLYTEPKDVLFNYESLLAALVNNKAHEVEEIKTWLITFASRSVEVEKMEQKISIDEKTKEFFIYDIQHKDNLELFKKKFDCILEKCKEDLDNPSISQETQQYVNKTLQQEALQIQKGIAFFKAMDIKPNELATSLYPAPKPTVSKLMSFISDSNLEVKNAYNETLMIVAAHRLQPQVLEALLITQQKDVNKGSESGKTALHRAAEAKDQTLAMQCCTLLIDAEAHANIEDKDGNMAFHYASSEELRDYLYNTYLAHDEYMNTIGEKAPEFTLDWQ